MSLGILLSWLVRYVLNGHLGGVMHLTSNRLGDTLVSVGMDKVAKVWKICRGILYPIR